MAYYILLLIILACILLSSASYLDAPRIHFSGHFRADAATTNNMPCNFDVNLPYTEQLNKDWNSVGTNEFSFVNAQVEGAVLSKGTFTLSDEVIGANIFDNSNQPFAKMVILDVDTENTTAIYGMVFGVSWPDDKEIAFRGIWTPNIIAQNLWDKVKCYYGDQDTFPRGAQATTTITDIKWGNLRDSPVLNALKDASSNALQVSVSFSFYTRNSQEFVQSNFTLGYITGTIGVSKEDEPLSYGGGRLLSPDGLSAPSLKFSTKSDSCYDKDPSLYNPWMFNAPFKVDQTLQVLTVDLSNSFPIDMQSTPRDIGEIYFAIVRPSQCIEIIQFPIPYHNSTWLLQHSAVIDILLVHDQSITLMHSPALVMVRLQDQTEDGVKICLDHSHKAKLMLKEVEYYVRPNGFYNARLVYPDTTNMPFLVTHLGNPAPNVTVKMATYRSVLPADGVTVENESEQTNENGLATFTFKVATPMKTTRAYKEPPCPDISDTTVLSIDGQSYQFKYYVCTDGVCPATPSEIDETPITIRAFSNIQYERPYTWDHHVEPILTQYYHLYPVMNDILNLSNYYSVKSPQNLGLMKMAMGQDFNDANFMPVTRDLPPSQQAMILEWLDNPIKNAEENFAPTGGIDDHTPELLPVPNCTEPQRLGAVSKFSSRVEPLVCTFHRIPYGDTDAFCDEGFLDYYYIETLQNNRYSNEEKRRPLYGFRKHTRNKNTCTLDGLKKQLQQAIELEFSTLPLYITSLYSIVESCNYEVYNLIRSVVMQEMIHMAQSSNILIAINGIPLIDSKDTVPRYPVLGLPGNVHPSLLITLEKASLQHIHDIFVAIEQPNITCIGRKYPLLANNTVGQFYREIEDCIETLGDGIFNASTEDIQVSWPWTPGAKLGTVYKVKDVKTALDGINEIIEQGEGASAINPNDTQDTLAHYYRFQEIVCRRKLVHVEGGYAYKGETIPFDTNGVWPMRDNPSKIGIKPNTNCYTEAKAFHQTYRALIRELQASFGGEPGRIDESVKVMESLLVHAKRVMRVPLDPDDHVLGYTCGPVWDYNWDD